MNWTESQLAEHLARNGKPAAAFHHPDPVTNANTARFALGRLPTGTMNKTEARYAAHLETLKIAGQVLWYRFEAIKLRLADNTFYTCDFAVMEADGTLAMHEVKGYMEEDANVKIKVAAASFPFRFVVIRNLTTVQGGGWHRTEY
jgi:hypothetical protein